MDFEKVEVVLFLKTFLESDGEGEKVDIYSASFSMEVRKGAVLPILGSTLHLPSEERLDRYYMRGEKAPEAVLTKIPQTPYGESNKIGSGGFLSQIVFEQIITIPRSVISEKFFTKIAEEEDVLEHVRRDEINYFNENIKPNIKKRGFILRHDDFGRKTNEVLLKTR